MRSTTAMLVLVSLVGTTLSMSACVHGGGQSTQRRQETWQPEKSNLVVQARPETETRTRGASPLLEFAMQSINEVVTNELSPSLSLRPTVGEKNFNEPTTVNVSRVSFADEGADFDPCISNDGTIMVYASTQHSTNADIYLKRVDSRVTTRLTNDNAQDVMPRISPDGSMVAFASDRSGNWDIYVMPVTGGKAIQVTQGLEEEIAPSWSPEGTQIVYSRMGQTSGRWEMWVASIENPDVANFVGYGLFPQWCPVAGTGDGGSDKILYQLGRERGRRSFGVWTLDVSNGKAQNAAQIASNTEQALINPCWSPDGKWIIYSQVPLDQVGQDSPGAIDSSDHVGPSHASLWMVSSDGEGQVRLTTGRGSALSPTWAHNDRLFFVSNRDGVDNVWAMDLAGALQTAMSTIKSSDTAMAKLATSIQSVPANEETEDASDVATANEDDE